MIIEIIGYAVPIIAGGFFLWLAFLNFGREKYAASLFFGGVASFFLLCSLPWFQGFAKTWFISNVNAKFTALGKQVDNVQTTIGEMQNQLSDHQKELNDVQAKIRVSQTNVLESQTAIISQHAQLSSMQTNLMAAQTNIQAQTSRIEDVESRLSSRLM